jgi:hypothetical protein
MRAGLNESGPVSCLPNNEGAERELLASKSTSSGSLNAEIKDSNQFGECFEGRF